MRDLPVPDPGTPDYRSATRYLWWIARLQRSTVIFGIACGIVWMLAQALMPYATGMAIGGGIAGATPPPCCGGPARCSASA